MLFWKLSTILLWLIYNNLYWFSFNSFGNLPLLNNIAGNTLLNECNISSIPLSWMSYDISSVTYSNWNSDMPSLVISLKLFFAITVGQLLTVLLTDNLPCCSFFWYWLQTITNAYLRKAYWCEFHRKEKSCVCFQNSKNTSSSDGHGFPLNTYTHIMSVFLCHKQEKWP